MATRERKYHVRNWRTGEVVKTGLTRLDAVREVAKDLHHLRIHDGAKPKAD